jgi:hypothetical protein
MLFSTFFTQTSDKKIIKKKLKVIIFLDWIVSVWRHDNRHNNTQHNDTQHNHIKFYTQNSILKTVI